MPTAPTRIGRYAPTGNYSTVTTPKVTVESFDMQVGDRFWAQAQVENDTNETVVTPSVSAGVIAWTLQIRQPAASGTGLTSAMWAWSGVCTTAATNVTISTPRPTSTTDIWWGFSATHVRGSDGIGVLFVGDSSTGTSAPSVTQTVSANSLLLINVNDWSAADGSSRAWRSGLVDIPAAYFRDVNHHATYGAYFADTGAGGSFNAGLTAPSMRWRLAGVEFLGATPAGPPVPIQLETGLGMILLEDGTQLLTENS